MYNNNLRILVLIFIFMDMYQMSNCFHGCNCTWDTTRTRLSNFYRSHRGIYITLNVAYAANYRTIPIIGNRKSQQYGKSRCRCLKGRILRYLVCVVQQAQGVLNENNEARKTWLQHSRVWKLEGSSVKQRETSGFLEVLSTIVSVGIRIPPEQLFFPFLQKNSCSG